MVRNYIPFVALSLLAFISEVFTPELRAGDFHWNAPVSGDFDDPANWLPSMVPSETDTAIFDLGSSGYTVNIGLETVDQLRFDNDTLTLQGFAVQAVGTVAPAIQFGSNSGDISRVTLNGSLYGNQILVGAHQYSEAEITLQGTLSTRPLFVFPPPTPQELVIGAAGSGVVNVTSGNVESDGSVILGRDASGVGQIYLNGGSLRALGTGMVVGQTGEAYLSVSGSSRADINGELMVGRDQGSYGDIKVSGPNAELRTPGYGNYRMTSTTIGGAGNGSLTAVEGAELQLEGPIVLGRDAGAVGSLSVDGADSRLGAYKRIPPAPVNSPGISVGMSGKGELSLTGGAEARLSGPIIAGQNAGAEGTILIAGEGTDVSPYGAGGASPLSLIVGDAGKGTATISGGATAEFSGIQVGNATSGEGTLSVDGSETNLEAYGMRIGNSGKGTATISGGATVKSEGPIVVGDTATGNGSLTITGQGTSFEFDRSNIAEWDQVVIGNHGEGTLTVSDLAIADFTDATLKIAPEAGSVGSVTVERPHSRINASRIEVGGQGTATLSVLDQGEVQVWDSPSGEGVIDVHPGGTLDILYGRLSGKDFEPLTLRNAGTTYSNGFIRGNVTNLPGGVLYGTGLITGELTQTGGTIAPGNSPGTMEVGAMNLQGGVLQIEMNSAVGVAGGPLGWDLIEVNGMAQINGPLTLELVSLTTGNDPGSVFDFNPMRDYFWTIVTTGAGSGIYDPNLVTVDTSQFLNPFDGEFALNVFGPNLVLSYTRAVPEPGTILLAGLGLAAMPLVRRRNRRQCSGRRWQVC